MSTHNNSSRAKRPLPLVAFRQRERRLVWRVGTVGVFLFAMAMVTLFHANNSTLFWTTERSLQNIYDGLSADGNVLRDPNNMPLPGASTLPDSSTQRRIPSVLLAGTQKASTTSLAIYLMDLNNTCFSDEDQTDSDAYGKESHFFDSSKYEVGLRYYQYLFRNCAENDVLIEGTPNTMLHPDKVRKIYDEQGTADELRIIFILREPVSREISWYNHLLRYTDRPNRPEWTEFMYNEENEPLSFIEVQRKNVIKLFQNNQTESLFGYYAHWLSQWTKLFDRKKQILILSYDELVNEPSTVLRRIHSFLDLPEDGPLVLPNENSNYKQTPPPPCIDQMELAEFFKGPNEELDNFLANNPGPDMEQWPLPKFQMNCTPPIPSVLLAGAPMSGVSSIADTLWSLPYTCFSEEQNTEGSIEESHFFDNPDYYDGGLHQYQQLFKDCGENTIIVDATPGAIVYPEEVKSIFDEQGTTQQLKIVFVLREPVGRQIAWYNVQRQLVEDNDPPIWKDTILNEDGSLRPFIDIQRQTVISDFQSDRAEFIYGNYVYWLRKWFSIFDRNQILILSHEELIQDPQMVMFRLVHFLGKIYNEKNSHFILDDIHDPDPDQPSCADQRELGNFFETPNEELYQLLKENPGPVWEQRPFPRFYLACEKEATPQEVDTLPLLTNQTLTVLSNIQPVKRIPSILLAGTQKASTTSMAEYLRKYPQTCFSDEDQPESESQGKESHFFDYPKYADGLQHYQYLFRKCPDDAILIEGTPNTMLHPERVRTIYDEHGTADELKIIFILREPVSREISWYNHQLRYLEKPDVPVWTRHLKDENGTTVSFIDDQRNTVIKHLRNKEYNGLFGYYAYWLRRWSNVFDRQRQILIISYEELSSAPATVLYRIHEFLGIRPGRPLRLPHANTNERNTPPPPCSDQLELDGHFQRINEEFYQFMEENPGPEIEQRPFPKFQLNCVSEL